MPRYETRRVLRVVDRANLRSEELEPQPAYEHLQTKWSVRVPHTSKIVSVELTSLLETHTHTHTYTQTHTQTHTHTHTHTARARCIDTHFIYSPTQ